MSPPIDRRRLLFGGAAGLGAVLLGGACSSGDDGDGDAVGSAGSSSTTSTPSGSSTTAGSVPAGGAITPAMFESAGSCGLTPEQTEGPYYLDVDKIRSDIREDREGTQLRVAVRVLDVDGCTPVKDAVFEIWHCDAAGNYSGFEDGRRGTGTQYLRGAQVTNGDGIAVITTIYPGWYSGRTVHIHAKVLLSNTDVLTTQFYFDEDLTKTVYRAAPYSSRGNPDQGNSDDSIYRRDTTLTVARDGDGYLGLITLGIRA